MRHTDHGITSIIVRVAAGTGLLIAGVSGIVAGLDDLAGQQVRTYLEGSGGNDPDQLVLYPVLLGVDTLASLLLVWAGIHGVCALPGNEGWRRCRKGVAIGASVKVAALVAGLLVLSDHWRGLYLDPGWRAADRVLLAGVAVLLAVGVIGVPRPWPGAGTPAPHPVAPDRPAGERPRADDLPSVGGSPPASDLPARGRRPAVRDLPIPPLPPVPPVPPAAERSESRADRQETRAR